MLSTKEAIVADWNGSTVYLEESTPYAEDLRGGKFFVIHRSIEDFRDGISYAVLADGEIRRYGKRIAPADEIVMVDTITLERDWMVALTNVSALVMANEMRRL